MTASKIRFTSTFIFMAIIIIMASVSSTLASQPNFESPRYQTQDHAQPIIVFIERDPWRMVIGSDSPAFVLYNTGLVIYRQDNHYQSVVLATSEYEDLLQDLAITDEFLNLDEYYDLALATDQPTNTIHVWNEGELKTVSVYGNLHTGDFLGPDEVPATFSHLFDIMTTYQHPDATEWFPDRIELLLWATDDTSGVAYPANFPTLDTPFAVRRGAERFSVFIDAADLDQLNDLHEESSVLLTNETGWWYSWRVPFPSEWTWRYLNADEIPSFLESEATLTAFGDAAFPADEWARTTTADYALNNFINIAVTWQHNDLSTTATYSRQINHGAFFDSEELLVVALTDRWLATEWLNVENVQVLNSCTVGDRVILDVSMTAQDNEQLVRYWIWQAGENGILLDEFTLTVSAGNGDILDSLAENVFPDAPRCP